MILSDEAVNAIYSGVVARGVTSLSDDDLTDTEYLWAALSDLQEARKQLADRQSADKCHHPHFPDEDCDRRCDQRTVICGLDTTKQASSR
jgi:hypothetical protein